MNNIRINSTNIYGTKCPHGAPIGACPSCAGGGGGGDIKKKYEMSWDECYAVGQMLKAAKLNAQLDRQIMRDDFIRSIYDNVKQNIFIQKLIQAGNFIQARILSLISEKIQPVSKLLSSIVPDMPSQLAKIKQNVQELFNKFINISDKIAAIFGEQEKILKEFLKINLNKIKKNFFGLLSPVDSDMEGEEDENDQEKNIFNFWIKKKNGKY